MDEKLTVLNGNRWKAALFLSVIVPMSFLATFKLTGLMGRVAEISETLTLPSVEWEFEKPSFSPDRPLWLSDPNEVLVRNSYLNEGVNITFTVNPNSYQLVNEFYDYSPVIVLNVNVTASVSEGSVEAVRIVFQEANEASKVRLMGVLGPLYVTWGNLTGTNQACLWYREWLLNSTVRAFVEAEGVGHPKGVLFDTMTAWILKVPDNVGQQLQVSAEVTYFDGTKYFRVVLPTVLRLVADAGDALEAARTISAGNCAGSVSCALDPADWYRIWLNESERVRISTVVCRVGANVTLYDSHAEQRANAWSSLSLQPKLLGEIAYTADVEGYCYIRVLSTDDQGLYRLTVTLEP